MTVCPRRNLRKLLNPCPLRLIFLGIRHFLDYIYINIDKDRKYSAGGGIRNKNTLILG